MQAEKAEHILQQIRFTNQPADCKADLIIEAIIEKPEAKIALFKQLMAINEPGTIFATNTSSLSVTSIAAGCERPQQVAGMHFFNPPALMKLVELVTTEFTDEGIVQELISLSI